MTLREHANLLQTYIHGNKLKLKKTLPTPNDPSHKASPENPKKTPGQQSAQVNDAPNPIPNPNLCILKASPSHPSTISLPIPLHPLLNYRGQIPPRHIHARIPALIALTQILQREQDPRLDEVHKDHIHRLRISCLLF